MIVPAPVDPPVDARRRDLAAVARGGTLNLAGIVANAVTAFAFSIIIARALGASGSGTFLVALALSTALETVAQFGADTGVMRMVSRYRGLGRLRDTATAVHVGQMSVLAFSTVLAASLFLFAPQVAEPIAPDHQGQMETYLRILAPALPLAAGLSVALAATRGFGNMLPYVLIGRVGRSVLRTITVLLAVVLGAGADALMVAAVVPVVAAYAAALAWLHRLVTRTLGRASAETPARQPTRTVAREFWAFTAPRGLASLVGGALLRVDVILLSALATAADAGIYAAANRVVAAGTFAQAAVVIVIGPQISELLAREELGRAREVYRVSTTWLTLMAFPLYVTIATAGPLVLDVFGSEFSAGAPALVIMSIAMLFNMLTGAVNTVLVVAGRTTWNLGNTLATAVVNVGLNFALIPMYGMTGAAIAFAASTVVRNGLPLLQIWKHLDMQPFSRPLALAVAGAIGCFGLLSAVVYAALGRTWPSFALVAALSAAAYALFLFRFRGTLVLDEFVAALRARRRRERS
jgi:O-antigen/teichoic acid export membrane protein